MELNKFKIAEAYIQAHKQNGFVEEQLNQALALFHQDNWLQLWGPIHQAYDELILELLGDKLYDLMLTWIYQLDYGKDQAQSFQEWVKQEKSITKS